MAKKSVRKPLAKARKGNAAKLKSATKKIKADAKVLHGASKPLTKAQIEEMFRRFKAANPEPKTELKYVNPFTLLVAVVLSAQATDTGVNKATPVSVAWAESTTATSSVNGLTYLSSVLGSGLAALKRRNISSICALV